MLADGKKVQGARDGLEELAVSLGAARVSIQTAKAVELTVLPSADERGFPYTVIVRVGAPAASSG